MSEVPLYVQVLLIKRKFFSWDFFLRRRYPRPRLYKAGGTGHDTHSHSLTLTHTYSHALTLTHTHTHLVAW